MSGFIQDDGENRFANGVSHCDLRVHSDAAERDSRKKAEEFSVPPIGKLLGMTITKIGNGQAIVELQADERHANPIGTIHGGVFCDIADAAMGLAYRSTLAESESLTTIELKINFLRPVWKAKLRARARVIRGGKILGFVECDVVDEQERLVARASSTCMTLRGTLADRSHQIQHGGQVNAKPIKVLT